MRLKKKKFDAGILFTNSLQSALLFKLAGIPQLLGYQNEGRSFLLARSLPRTPNNRHHHFYYLRLIEEFCSTTLDASYPASLNISAAEKADLPTLCQRIGIDLHKPLIGIAPTAAYGSAKAWPAEKYKQLWLSLKELHPDWQALVLASKGERGQTTLFDGMQADSLFNTAGQLSLRDSIKLISACSIFISNDSGLMHVAAGLAIPLVAIFGPTRPEKTSPLGSAQILLYKPVACAPCMHRACPTDHACMHRIGSDDVMAAIARLGGEA